MNLICCICKNEISDNARIAKIISIKRIQQDGTDARIEYTGDQEELYIHFNCLQKRNITINPCLANDENFNQDDSRIIGGSDVVLSRNDLLGFLRK